MWRAPGRVAGVVRRRLGILILSLACMGAHCRSTRPGTFDVPPPQREHREGWDRLDKARRSDPGGAEARQIAEELLAGDAPLPVRLAALRAKAEHAYRYGDDGTAIAAADRGLALVPPHDDSQVVVDLARTRARALVRGGEPHAALEALDGPRANARGGWDPDQARGLYAIAFDRADQGSAAVAALARWRESLPDDGSTAQWVEQRITRRSESLSPTELDELVAQMPPSAGRMCLEARRGGSVDPDAPGWVAACTAKPGEIGVLLPRSGPLAAFADEHLAAVLATIEVMAARGPVPPLQWQDSGSSAATTQSAARALIGNGAHTLVGPIGAKNVQALTHALDPGIRAVVPGEGSDSVPGVAPSLEQRVGRLVDLARVHGRDRLVVLAPDTSYGRRAVHAVQQHARGFAQPVMVRMYPAATTSFGPHIDPVMTALAGNTALLVPDTLVRTELVVRQLARAGRGPARDDAPGLMVLATAEGVSSPSLASGRQSLEGVWIAPAAARGPAAVAFESAYTRMQGEPPGDQGFLVFYALEQAITGQPGPGVGQATLTRVRGGQLVVQSTPAER